jgi:hypothetical protein
MPIVDYGKIQESRSGGRQTMNQIEADRPPKEQKEGGDEEGDEEVVPVVNTSVDYKHITRKTKQKEYLKEVEVRRSVALEREHQHKLAKEEAERQRKAGAQARAGVIGPGVDEDDDDCPPLM